MTEKEISRRLVQHGGRYPEADAYPEGFFSAPPVPASVLMSLFRKDDSWHLLYIRRADNEQDRHSGQVAFPGGKVDPGDRNAIEAALREAQEEIGLSPGRVQVLGCMNEYRTVSNYLVKPVVCLIDGPLRLVPDQTEVSRIFSIPLDWLADRGNLHRGRRKLKGYDQEIPVLYYQEYQDELLWGITARLTESLIRILGLR